MVHGQMSGIVSPLCRCSSLQLIKLLKLTQLIKLIKLTKLIKLPQLTMTWILVPAKASTDAKSRLAPVLSEEARSVLARLLLARLLTIIEQEAPEATVLVVSDDAGLQAIARLFGQRATADPPARRRHADALLNAVLDHGREIARQSGARALLVLPTDLPWLAPPTFAALWRRCQAVERGVVVAPDHHGAGTNALFQRPLDAIPFAFGPRSAQRHAEAARHAALPLHWWHGHALAHDLDQPSDWQRWLRNRNAEQVTRNETG